MILLSLINPQLITILSGHGDRTDFCYFFFPLLLAIRSFQNMSTIPTMPTTPESSWLQYLQRDESPGPNYPPVPFEFGFSVRTRPWEYAESSDVIGPFKDGEQPMHHDYPKSVEWYKESIPRQFCSASVVRLIINYSKIRGKEIIAHLLDIASPLLRFHCKSRTHECLPYPPFQRDQA